MSQTSPLQYRAFCIAATAVNVAGFILPPTGLLGLTLCWSLFVILYAGFAVHRAGWNGLGWPALTLVVMGLFHPAVILLLVGVLLICVVYATIVSLARRDSRRPAQQKTTTKEDFVSVAVPGGKNGSDVLARFGMKVR